MKYTIVYDKYSRLRVRIGEYIISVKQAKGLEDEINALDFVEKAEVNRKSGSILVMYKQGQREKVLNFISALDRKTLPERELTPSEIADENFKSKLAFMIAKRFIMKFVPMPIRSVFIFYNAAKFVLKGLDCLLKCEMKVEMLDAASIGISVIRGQQKTAASIMFLLNLSELLESYTKERTRLALEEQLSLNIDSVWIETTEGAEKQVPFDKVSVGDQIIIRTGSVIPFDGTVCGDEAMVNQSTMTGESEPVHKKEGDSVFAGSVVEAGRLKITVRSLSEDSRLQKIVSLIDESEQLKAGIQSSAEQIADSIVPYSFLGFGLTYLLTGNITKALSVLMVDFSCALKLSTPISVISAMREAAAHGCVVKGGKYLEAFAQADTIVFDKTGTLTKACPQVTDVVPFNGFKRDYVLKTAACLEEHFPHSVANAVVKKACDEGLIHEEEHAQVEYLVAHGIITHFKGKRAIIGSAHFVFEDEKVPVTEEIKAVIEEKSCDSSAIFLAVGGVLAGMLVITDPPREDANEMIKKLRKEGITHICMLTGDSETAAKRVASQLGIDSYVSEVLPEDKCEFVKKLQSGGRKVIMIGDGINDTPALSAADVSVAMCGGSDIAREVADISLNSDDLYSLIELRKISRALMNRIKSNYRFIAGFNSALIISGISGIIPPSVSSIMHNGSTMLVAAKSMRPFIS